MADAPVPKIQIVIDCADPHAQVAFWAAALAYEVEDHTEVVDGLVAAGQLPPVAVADLGDGRRGFTEVATAIDPAGDRPRLFFQQVPEEKVVKNRVHLDLHVGPERVDGEVARLTGLGATFAWETVDRGPKTVTLRDPEGNELCLS